MELTLNQASDVAPARQDAASFARRHGLSDNAAIYWLKVVVSELASNMLNHAAPPFVMRLRSERPGVVVVTAEQARPWEPPRRHGENVHAEGGRGLQIIEELAYKVAYLDNHRKIEVTIKDGP